MKSARLVSVFACCLIPLSAFGHPHYFKEVRFSFDRDKESNQSIVVSHITVPYNEIATASLPEGGDWHLGFAKLEVGSPLDIGGSRIDPGLYSLKVKRGPSSEWSLFLVPDKEGGEEGKIELESELKAGLPEKEHLEISIQPYGSKEDVRILLSVRFGPNGLSVPLKQGN